MPANLSNDDFPELEIDVICDEQDAEYLEWYFRNGPLHDLPEFVSARLQRAEQHEEDARQSLASDTRP